MSLLGTDEILDVSDEQALSNARLVLADLTSYDDQKIYDAAAHVAAHGETQNERERALAFMTLLSGLVKDDE